MAYTDGYEWHAKDPVVQEFLTCLSATIPLPRLMHVPDRAYYIAHQMQAKLKELGFFDAEVHESFDFSHIPVSDQFYPPAPLDISPLQRSVRINPEYVKHLITQAGIRPIEDQIIPGEIRTAITAYEEQDINGYLTSGSIPEDIQHIIGELDIYFTAIKPLPHGSVVYTTSIPGEVTPGMVLNVPYYLDASIDSGKQRYEIHCDGLIKGLRLDENRLILNRGIRLRVDSISDTIILTPEDTPGVTPEVKVAYSPSAESEEIVSSMTGETIDWSHVKQAADAFTASVDDRLVAWKGKYKDFASDDKRSWFARSKAYVNQVKEMLRSKQHEMLYTGKEAHMVYQVKTDAVLSSKIHQLTDTVINPTLHWLRTHIPQQCLNRVMVEFICEDEDGRSAMVGYDEYQEIYLMRQAFEDPSVIIHEMGHVIEMTNLGIRHAALRFLAFRAGNTRLIRLTDAYPDWGYSADEIAYPDHFPTAYCGKIYEDMSTELISMGMEYLYRDPMQFMTQDPEYYKFMIDVCKGRYT